MNCQWMECVGYLYLVGLALPLPRFNSIRYKYPTQSIHWHTSFTCLWRWNRQWVPKRRLLELKRRGITQKGTHYKKEWVCRTLKTVVHSLGQETREWLAENWSQDLENRMLDWAMASTRFIGYLLSYGTGFYVSTPWSTFVLQLKFKGRELNLAWQV